MFLAISAMLFIAMVGKSISINFWQKILYDKEIAEEKKKRDFKIAITLWAILTLIGFVFVVFFAKK